MTEPVVMELLQGARDAAHESRLRSMISAYPLMSLDTDIDFDTAADVYRRCRRRGLAVHSLDCMIAAVAMRHDSAVLSADADFAKIASVVPLRLDPATPR